ncbi:FtsX-like permease family protein [Micromonospora endolithica]|uniref:FtsX-like permease family protein n=1 Tax=Micromonospora endolithica TaxID=230091 RepID=A0A3A9Z0I4_9ACTN|nr:FtsX-like permease family protein [Micromonospora endolithica]RKN41434.1 FtsX-like permease family protein [Micromonospora endolithica]TWJ21858.1 FtsX-like permease family protein [Micromonospora endolithica]
MRLALRRAKGAKGLLLAAAGATLVATAALTGLSAYNGDVVASGTGSVLAAATPEERSILVRGPAGGSAATLRERDAALRAHVTAGLTGLDPRITAAGFAAGRQLRGDIGAAEPDEGGAAYASVMFLDDLAAHARLTAGAWPQPGATPVQTALAAPVAATLGVGVGDRIPVTDGFTGRVTQVGVVGVWQPTDPADTYWRLAPEVASGTLPGSATYGPLTVHRDDFDAHFRTNASAGWLVEPDLSGVTAGAGLDRLAGTAGQVAAGAPEAAGLGDSGTAITALDDLAQRVQRATLVGRSALVTPMLLVVVLGGYALLLVAVLLTEHRRAESALLRARGAARWQLVGLTVREAALVVVPAAALAPPLAGWLLSYADRVPALAALSLRPSGSATLWVVAALAAAGCALAMVAPALRRGGTYVADQAARSRPSRRGAVQRAGVDVLLVALAVLAWYQLRQYSSPLSRGRSGGLEVDPLLAAAPTIGVLAGAVLALRLLPPLTRLAERWVDRKPWTATILGTWQAGRRPHAGPVLLLALAVAVGTLAWCLAATSERSLADQANHQVGADLRLTEVNGSAPTGRADQIAGLPGTRAALASWREPLRLGPVSELGSLVALDAGQADGVVRLRPDLADSGALRALAEARVDAAVTELPTGARRFTGEVLIGVSGLESTVPVQVHAVLVDPHGGHREVSLGAPRDGEPMRFAVDLPAGSDPPRLAGFTVETVAQQGMALEVSLRDLRSSADDSPGTPVDLGADDWRWVDREGSGADVRAAGATLSVRWLWDDTSIGTRATPVRMAVVRGEPTGPVPVLATPSALDSLRTKVGTLTRLYLAGAEVEVKVVGVVDSVPGGTEPGALLADLPSLSSRLLYDRGITRDPQQWWLSVDPDERTAASDAAVALGGLAVADRQVLAGELAGDPFGVGARGALFAAALAAVLLAAVGVAVDVSATARRRATELAVLHTLGAGHRLVARSLLAEQAFLAGLGVLVGLLVGVGVAATMAPLVILTPSADRPIPTPLLQIDWTPVAATGAGLLLLALAFSAGLSLTMRRRLTATQLRIGGDR